MIQVRLIIGALMLAMAAGLWFAIDSTATTRAELAHEQARSEALAKQVAGVAEEYQGRLNAQEEGYRVRDSRRQATEKRKDEAEARYQRAGSEAHDWGADYVPAAVTVSLCFKPGSCIVPAATEAASRPDEASAGDAAERQLQLTNESLLRGNNDCRADLGAANAQLAGLCAWCEEKIGECGCASEVGDGS